MGRPERSLSLHSSPAAELATALRAARQAVGSPPYRQMARVAHYSAATLARAAAGNVLPSLDVTLAYATACGGRRAEWTDRWNRARAALERELAARQQPAVTPAVPPRPRPAQLPAAPPGFTGRTAELARLDAASVTAGHPGSPVLLAISGPAGIGKTTLALHWAHRAADRYPDGQLYADLQGFAAVPPLRPVQVLTGFLRALGMPEAQIPADVAGAAAAYRSLVAGARMLIVLDNAVGTDQVRPVLPGSAGCAVLVTSREQLTTLVAADGAQPVALDLLTAAEARELLARRLGTGRAASESAAVEELIMACGRLPLALSIVAARVSAEPATSLSSLVHELRETAEPLDALDLEDGTAGIRQMLSWSCQDLHATGARMFRLLGLHPGPDLTVTAAASLAGLPVPAAHRALRALTRRSLLAEPETGRFALHDLLRAYAAEQAQAAESGIARHAAVLRLLDHYLHAAHEAQAIVHPNRAAIRLDPAEQGVSLLRLTDQDALAWFDAEYRNLLAAVGLATAGGYDRHVWQLAWALATFFLRRNRTDDWVHTQRLALDATRRLGDGVGEALIHLGLSRAYASLARYQEAARHAQRALAFYRELGELRPQGRAHLSLNLILARQGCPDEAVTHAQQALAIFAEADDRHGQAAAHNAIGWHHALRGERTESITHCTRAVRLFQDTGDAAGEAAAWDSLGQAHARSGDYQGAVASYQRAIELGEQAGAARSQADSLTHLGDAHDAFGRGAAARDAWKAALAILTESGHPDAGLLAERLGQPPGSRGAAGIPAR